MVYADLVTLVIPHFLISLVRVRLILFLNNIMFTLLNVFKPKTLYTLGNYWDNMLPKCCLVYEGLTLWLT